MKNYAIYQFFIDKTGQERNLLVGFAKGLNSKEAIENFTDDDFRRGYLSVIECAEGENERLSLQKAIKSNLKELGVWA